MIRLSAEGAKLQGFIARFQRFSALGDFLPGPLAQTFTSRAFGAFI
jgi:hypothetical protein